MSANVAATLVYTLLLAFFVVVALGVALGVYAATQLRKCQEQLKSYQEEAPATPAVVQPVPADEV